MSILKNNSKYISFKGKRYALNLDTFKAVCTPNNKDIGTREYEISQVYEVGETGEMSMSSKVEHETKGTGNPQNDMIVYDVIKMLIISLLENDKTEKEFEYDFGTAFAINTLLSIGVLVEVE